jgi:hypothetical protein
MNSFNLKLFNFSSFKKIVSSITLTCFIITTLYTSGFSSIFEEIKDKNRTPQSVYHRWATVSEQIQGKQLTEFEDKEKNQVYRFNKEGKLVELEDRNKGVIFKYTYDEKGKPKVEVVNLKQKESQNVETSKEKQEKQAKQQDELTLAKAESFTNKLLNSPPEKQQKMLESIGLSVEEAKNLSKEEIKQKVVEYIQTNKNLPEGEVTVKQLTQNLQQLLNNTRNALTMLFANIIKQLVGEKKKEQEGEVLVSIEDIQQAAEKQGIKLNSNNINFEQLKETLKSSPVIVHLRDGDKGLFLIVTDIKDDKVIGIDANGKKTVIMDVNQFLFKWDGKTLSVANIGEELDSETKKNTKGTFFAKLFDNIKKIFTKQPEITQKTSVSQPSQTSQQSVQPKQQTQQTTTQTNQTDAQQAIGYIEQWLNEYLNADPAKQAQIAAQLGLSVDQLANLTAEKVQQIITYLKSHADSVINCAVEALKNVLNSAGKAVQVSEIAAKAILVDILTGNFQITSTSTYNASQVQISAFALQKVAASFGVAIFGYSTDIEGLKQALQEGPAIVWMDLGNGMGHYVTVTGIQNGQVTYRDSDGKTYTISVEEFQTKASGGVRVLSQKEGIKGEKLTEEQLRKTKGAEGVEDSGWVDGGWGGGSEFQPRGEGEGGYGELGRGAEVQPGGGGDGGWGGGSDFQPPETQQQTQQQTQQPEVQQPVTQQPEVQQPGVQQPEAQQPEIQPIQSIQEVAQIPSQIQQPALPSQVNQPQTPSIQQQQTTQTNQTNTQQQQTQQQTQQTTQTNQTNTQQQQNTQTNQTDAHNDNITKQEVVNRTYDKDGHITGEEVVNRTYDQNGNLIRTEHIVTNRTYDDGDLEKEEITKNTYDQNGNHIGEEKINRWYDDGDLEKEEITRNTYDQNGNHIGEEKIDRWYDDGNLEKEEITRNTYDKDGNRIEEKIDRWYDDGNLKKEEITRNTYDKDGNRIGEEVVNRKYDKNGHITKEEEVNRTYDKNGNLIKEQEKVVNRTYDKDGNLVKEQEKVVNRTYDKDGNLIEREEIIKTREKKGDFIEESEIKKTYDRDGNLINQTEKRYRSNTQTNQIDAQESISYIEKWLNEYLNADPAKQAQIAAQLGLSVDQLANLTAEKVQQIITYLKSHADSIINSAVEALKNVLNSAGKIFETSEIAAKAILVDILTGNFQITSTSTYNASQVQISAFALQKVAASFGVAIFGYSTDIEGLKQALQEGPAIVWMDLGNGMGHYVTVTGIQNGQVTYRDSDGKTYTISVEEFQTKASGGVRVLSQKEGIKGEKLTEEALKELRGTIKQTGNNVEVVGIELLGDNKVRSYEIHQNGENRSYREFVGNYVGNDPYKPVELNNIKGFETEYKGGVLIQEKELSGSLKNIEWDKMQIKAFTPDNYAVKLVYSSNPNEIGLTELYNGGRIEYRRNSKISEKEYTEILGVDVNELRQQGKIDNEWFTTKYDTVEIYRGVNKQVIDPDGKVVQNLTVNQIMVTKSEQNSTYGEGSKEVSLRWASNITDNLKGIQTTVLNGKQTTILDSEGREREVHRDTGEYQTKIVDPSKAGLPGGSLGADIEWKREVENIKYNYEGEQKNPSSREFDITTYDYIDRTETHRVGTEEYLAYKDDVATEVKTYQKTDTYNLDNRQLTRSEVSYTHETNIHFEGPTRTSDIVEQTTAVIYDASGKYDGRNAPYITTLTNGKREQTFDILGRVIDEKSSGNVKTWQLNNVDTIKGNLSTNNLKGVIGDIASNTVYKGDVLEDYDFNEHNFNYSYDILDRPKSYQFERDVVNHLDPQKSGNVSGRVEFNYTDKVEQIQGRNVLKTTYDVTTTITHINGEELDEPLVDKQEGLTYIYNFGYQNPININIGIVNTLNNTAQLKPQKRGGRGGGGRGGIGRIFGTIATVALGILAPGIGSAIAQAIGFAGSILASTIATSAVVGAGNFAISLASGASLKDAFISGLTSSIGYAVGSLLSPPGGNVGILSRFSNYITDSLGISPQSFLGRAISSFTTSFVRNLGTGIISGAVRGNLNLENVLLTSFASSVATAATSPLFGRNGILADMLGKENPITGIMAPQGPITSFESAFNDFAGRFIHSGLSGIIEGAVLSIFNPRLGSQYFENFDPFRVLTNAIAETIGTFIGQRTTEGFIRWLINKFGSYQYIDSKTGVPIILTQSTKFLNVISGGTGGALDIDLDAPGNQYQTLTNDGKLVNVTVNGNENGEVKSFTYEVSGISPQEGRTFMDHGREFLVYGGRNNIAEATYDLTNNELTVKSGGFMKVTAEVPTRDGRVLVFGHMYKEGYDPKTNPTAFEFEGWYKEGENGTYQRFSSVVYGGGVKIEWTAFKEGENGYGIVKLNNRGEYTYEHVNPPLSLKENNNGQQIIIYNPITINTGDKEFSITMGEVDGKLFIDSEEIKLLRAIDRNGNSVTPQVYYERGACKSLGRDIMQNADGFWIKDDKGYWRPVNTGEVINGYQVSVTQVDRGQEEIQWKLSIENPQNSLEIFGYEIPRGSKATINFYTDVYDSTTGKMVQTDGRTEIVSHQNSLVLERGSISQIILGQNGSMSFNKDGSLSLVIGARPSSYVTFNKEYGVETWKFSGNLNFAGKRPEEILLDGELSIEVRGKDGRELGTLNLSRAEGSNINARTTFKDIADPIFGFKIESDNKEVDFIYDVTKRDIELLDVAKVSRLIATPGKGVQNIGSVYSVYEGRNVNGKIETTSSLVLREGQSEKYGFHLAANYYGFVSDNVLIVLDIKGDTYSIIPRSVHLEKQEETTNNGKFFIYSLAENNILSLPDVKYDKIEIVTDEEGRIRNLYKNISEINLGNNNWEGVKYDISSTRMFGSESVVLKNGDIYYRDEKERWQKAEVGQKIGAWTVTEDGLESTLGALGCNSVKIFGEYVSLDDNTKVTVSRSDGKTRIVSDNINNVRVNEDEVEYIPNTNSSSNILGIVNNSQIAFTADSFIISNGGIVVGGEKTRIERPRGGARSGGEDPIINTNAVIDTYTDHYEVSNGVVSIVNGQAMIDVVGTIYKQGSRWIDKNGNVTSVVLEGNLQRVGYYEDRYGHIQDVFVSEGERTILRQGNVIVEYDPDGVKVAYRIDNLKGVTLLDEKTLEYTHFVSGTRTTYFKTTEATIGDEQYRVLQLDKDGRLVVDKVIYNNAKGYIERNYKVGDTLPNGDKVVSGSKLITRYFDVTADGKIVINGGVEQCEDLVVERQIRFENEQQGTSAEATLRIKVGSGVIKFDKDGNIILNTTRLELQSISNLKINGIETNLNYNPNKGYFEVVDKATGQPIDETFSGKFNNQEVVYQIIGVKTNGENLEDLNLVIKNYIAGNERIDNITVRSERFNVGGGRENREQPSFGPDSPRFRVTGDNNRWNIENIGEEEADFIAEISLREAVSGEIKKIIFNAFEAGTIVVAGEGGFSVNVQGVIEKPVYIGGIQVNTERVDMQSEGRERTIFVPEGTEIRIYNEGGINANLQYSTGEIFVRDNVKITDMYGEELFNGTREIDMRDGKVVGVSCNDNKNIGRVNDEMRIYIGDGRYIDMKSLNYDIQTTSFAQLWDGVVGTSAMIIGGLGSLITLGQSDFFRGLSNFGTNITYAKSVSEIVNYLSENWQGIAYAAATGAAGGALLGALPGAIIGAVGGAISYISHGIRSGGKGSGFTGNQIIDGIIHGLIGALSGGIGSLVIQIPKSLFIGSTEVGLQLAPRIISGFSLLESAINASFIEQSLVSATDNIVNHNYLGAAIDILMTTAFVLFPVGSAGRIGEASLGMVGKTALEGTTGVITRETATAVAKESAEVATETSIEAAARSSIEAAIPTTLEGRVSLSLRLGTEVGGLFAGSSIIDSFVREVAPTIQMNLSEGKPIFDGISWGDIGKRALISGGIGLLIGGALGIIPATTRLAVGWERNIENTLTRYISREGYEGRPITSFILSYIETGMKTGRDLALFNASPFGVAVNYAISKFEGREYNYFDSIKQGFEFGFFAGPSFAMAIPGAAIGEEGSKLNNFMTRWANEGPWSAFTGDRITAFMPKSWFTELEKSSPLLAQQIKMVEMVSQYQLVSMAGGYAGWLIDRVSGNYFGKGFFSTILSDISFFFVPTPLQVSPNLIKAEAILRSGNEKSLELAKDILKAAYKEEGINNSRFDINLTKEEVEVLRKSAETVNILKFAENSLPLESLKKIHNEINNSKVEEGMTLGEVFNREIEDGLKNIVVTRTIKEYVEYKITEEFKKAIETELANGNKNVLEFAYRVVEGGSVDRVIESIKARENEALSQRNDRIIQQLFNIITTLDNLNLTSGLREKMEEVLFDKARNEILSKNNTNEYNYKDIVERIKEGKLNPEDFKDNSLLRKVADDLATYIGKIRENINQLEKDLNSGFSHIENNKYFKEYKPLIDKAQTPEERQKLAKERNDKIIGEYEKLINNIKEFEKLLIDAYLENRVEIELETNEKFQTLVNELFEAKKTILVGEINKIKDSEEDSIAKAVLENLCNKIESDNETDKIEFLLTPNKEHLYRVEVIKISTKHLIGVAGLNEGDISAIIKDGEISKDIKEKIRKFLEENKKSIDDIAQDIINNTDISTKSGLELIQDILKSKFNMEVDLENISSNQINADLIEKLLIAHLGIAASELKKDNKSFDVEKSINQVAQVFSNLLGGIVELPAGGGKTIGFLTAASMSRFLLKENNVVEYLVAKPTDISQLTTGGNGSIARKFGFDIVNGRDLWEKGEDGIRELVKIYEGQKDTIVVYDLHSRGFVELASHTNEKLDRVLDRVSIRIVDEADVGALSRVAFVLGRERFAPQDLVEKVFNLYKDIIGKLGLEEDNKKLIDFKAVESEKELKKGDSFMINRDKVVYSESLKNKINELIEDKHYTQEMIDNFFRALDAVQNEGRKIGFDKDGNPVPVEGGRYQFGTTDQSATYNVASVLLKMEKIHNGRITEEIRKNGISSKEGVKYDLNRVKISDSMGEATLSEVFRRGNCLTFGGSATMDVAREIARSIYGTQAIRIEERTLDDYKKQENWAKMNLDKEKGYREFKDYNRDEIIKKAVEMIIDTIKEGDKEGREGGRIVIGECKFGDLTNEIINRLKGKGFGDKILVIDAEKISQKGDRYLVDVAQRKIEEDKQIIFVNEAGLRAVDWRKIDLIILDAHNFNMGDLLQALGRAGRTSEYESRITVFADKEILNRDVEEAKKCNDAAKMFGIKDENITKLGELTKNGNPIEIVAQFNSLRQKTDSILFKAQVETANLLLKLPVEKLLSEANGNDKEVLDKTLQRIITHNEAVLKGEIVDKYDSPKDVMERLFNAQKDNAIKELQMLREKVESESIRSKIDWLIESYEKVDFGEIWNKATKESEVSFKDVPSTVEEAILTGKNPAEIVAQTLAKLGQSMLPTESEAPSAKRIVVLNLNEALNKLPESVREKTEEILKEMIAEFSDGREVLTDRGIRFVENVKNLANPQWLTDDRKDAINKFISIINNPELQQINEENKENKIQAILSLAKYLVENNIDLQKAVTVGRISLIEENVDVKTLIQIKDEEFVVKTIKLLSNKIEDFKPLSKTIQELDEAKDALQKMILSSQNSSIIDRISAYMKDRKYKNAIKQFEKQSNSLAQNYLSEKNIDIPSLVLGITLDKQGNLRFDEEKIKEVRNVLANLQQLGLSVENVKAKDIKDVVGGRRTSISLIENLAKRQNNEQLQGTVSRLNEKLESGVGLNKVEVIANELGMPKEQIISMIDLTANPKVVLNNYNEAKGKDEEFANSLSIAELKDEKFDVKNRYALYERSKGFEVSRKILESQIEEGKDIAEIAKERLTNWADEFNNATIDRKIGMLLSLGIKLPVELIPFIQFIQYNVDSFVKLVKKEGFNVNNLINCAVESMNSLFNMAPAQKLSFTVAAYLIDVITGKITSQQLQQLQPQQQSQPQQKLPLSIQAVIQSAKVTLGKKLDVVQLRNINDLSEFVSMLSADGLKDKDLRDLEIIAYLSPNGSQNGYVGHFVAIKPVVQDGKVVSFKADSDGTDGSQFRFEGILLVNGKAKELLLNNNLEVIEDRTELGTLKGAGVVAPVEVATNEVAGKLPSSEAVKLVSVVSGLIIDETIRNKAMEEQEKFKDEVERAVANNNLLDNIEQETKTKVTIKLGDEMASTPVRECYAFEKGKYQIIYYFVDDKQKVGEEKNKYAQIKQVLGDKVVRFAVLDKQIDGKQAVVIVSEKVDSLDTIKPEIGLKQVAEINKVLWMYKMRDVELGNNENWKNNYGVNIRVEVVLSNPTVVSNEAIPENKPIGEIVKINDELKSGGYLKESDLTCWGSPKGPQLDPFGLVGLASILSDVATKGKELRSIPKLIRGAA